MSASQRIGVDKFTKSLEETQKLRVRVEDSDGLLSNGSTSD